MSNLKLNVPMFCALVVASGTLPFSAFGQSCTTQPASSSFAVDALAVGGDLNTGEYTNSAAGAVQIAVAPDGRVFVAKMETGQVRVYIPGVSNNNTVLAGTVPHRYNNEDGLLGVVASHDYATTKWIYVFYTASTWPTSPANADTGRNHVLARYTYNPDAAAGSQLTNPKVILRVQRMIDSRAYHAGGGIDISSDGVLVIGTGDDTSPHAGECTGSNNSAPLITGDRGCDAQKSAGNTASLRGKYLRIVPKAFPDTETPVPGIGSTYEIPPGNLWEYIDKPEFNPNWNPSFTASGTTARDSVSKVRKEIYTTGHRNPYHIRIDTKSGWLFGGEVGLDAASPSTTRGPEGREEWNLATAPGFFGHPYCVSNNEPWRKYLNNAWSTTEYYNCAAVQNISPNNYGIINLPPAKPALLWYSNNNTSDDGTRLGITGNETAVGGPMYRYNPSMPTTGGKFPPYYEGKVFFFDWQQTGKNFRVIHLNPNGTIPAGTASVPAFTGASLSGLPTGSYIDMRFGPHDGAMYLLRFSTGAYSANGNALYRIRYTGTYDNSCFQEFVATVGPGPLAPVAVERPAIHKAMAPSAAFINGSLTLPIGYRTVALYNLSGRKMWSHTRDAADRSELVKVPDHLANGVLQARLTP